jgi:hypothetical protein
MTHLLRKLSLAALLLLGALAFTACSDNNEIEDAADDLSDAARDVAEETGDAVEDAADEIEDATN